MEEHTPTYRRLAYQDSWLHVMETGPTDAEPLLLLHGYLGSHRAWRNQVESLARTWRVIAPDWFGWGQSGRPVHWNYDFESEVERLAGVLDALELDQVSFAGHDYGAFLGLGLAVRYPERIRRLMVLNSRAHRTFNLTWYVAFGTLSIACRFAPTRFLLERLPLSRMHRRSMATLVRCGILDQKSLSSYVDWMEEDPGGRAWFTRFMGQYRVNTRSDLEAGLLRLKCPCSIVWGDPDAYIPTSVARDLADRIPGASLTLVPRSSHFVMEHQPARVLAAMEAWLDLPVDSPGPETMLTSLTVE